MLELPDHPLPSNLLSRSSSFHSLPGFILESNDDDVTNNQIPSLRGRRTNAEDEKLDQDVNMGLTSSRSFCDLRTYD